MDMLQVRMSYLYVQVRCIIKNKEKTRPVKCVCLVMACVETESSNFEEPEPHV